MSTSPRELARPDIPKQNSKRFLRYLRKWSKFLIPKSLRRDNDAVPQPMPVEPPIWTVTTPNPTFECLHISEVLCLIFEFVRQLDYNTGNATDGKPLDGTMGKRTLASLARTCRAFREPALDALWMRLDQLDSLIKLLPEQIFKKQRKKNRVHLGDDRWLMFRSYAKRVKFVRAPCRRIPASTQSKIFTSLAHLSDALPLLPNLTELVWSDWKMSNLDHTSVSLLKYFAGPQVTAISVFLGDSYTPVSYNSLPVLSELFSLCTNATSVATYFTTPTYTRWTNEDDQWWGVWQRQTTLSTSLAFGLELHGFASPLCIDGFPTTVQEFSLSRNWTPSRSLQQLHPINSAPTRCRILCRNIISDVESLLDEALPNSLDMSQIQSLSIETPDPVNYPKFLTNSVISSLQRLSTLRELDMDTLGSETLQDNDYKRIARSLTRLRVLKVGTRARPGQQFTQTLEASVEALLLVLEGCRNLETLHILFDASGFTGPPTPQPLVDTRGISNQRITSIRVGHSPIVQSSAYDVATYLHTLMPRLERIEWTGEGGGSTWKEVEDQIGKLAAAVDENPRPGAVPPGGRQTRFGWTQKFFY